MMTNPVLFWFRQDLRISDQPGLLAAAEKGPVAAVYVLDDSLAWPMGGASRWWLHHSLLSLAGDLKKLGVPLILRKGTAHSILPQLASETKASAVYWNRVYEPAAIARDTAIKSALKASGVETQSFNGSLLFEPWEIKNGSGNPFKVFTPFARACLSGELPDMPVPPPEKISGTKITALSDDLASWMLLPTKPDWAKPLAATWAIGEKAAQQRLQDFFAQALPQYAAGRDRPDEEYTSRLSPHLHFGEISPRQVFYALRAWMEKQNAPALTKQADKFVSELLWREFAHALLYHHPHMPDSPLQKNFAHFPWQEDEALLTAWTRGETGIPIVDAGMRQLWQTGWMHNRVRMIVASLLTKNLLQPWQAGAAWFWDTLVDANLANNSASWQWVAGCGMDAAPYYRIFNPVLQGQKFDPQGDYVRRYVPELARLPAGHIHAPWDVSATVLKDSGVVLGKDYPKPIVDLKQSRARALAAYQRIKNA